MAFPHAFLCAGLRIVVLRMIPALGLAVFAASALAIQSQRSIDFEVLIIGGGKPASEAVLWVDGWAESSGDRSNRKMVGPLKANDLGLVQFSLPAVEPDQMENAYFQVLTQHGKDEIGLGKWRLRRYGNFHGVNRLTLYLQKAKSVEGQLFLEGKPLVGVQCQLESIGCQTQNDCNNPALIDFRRASFSAPLGSLSSSTKTDAEGRFSLGGVPEEGSASVEFRAEGLGTGHSYQRAKFPFNAELVPGALLDLAIEGQSEPVTIKKIDLRSTAGKGMAIFRIDGRSHVDMIPGKRVDRAALTVPGVGGVLAGSRRLSIPLDPALGYHFGFDQTVNIEPGKTTKVVLKKIPVGICSGRIVDAKTGKGIANLNFRLKGTEKWRGERFANQFNEFYEKYAAKTDAEGNYAIPCKWKLVYMLDFGEPRDNHTDYELPEWEEVVQRWIPFIPHAAVADGEKVRLRDVSLTQSRTVKGIERDESGKVVDGPYEVRCPTRPARQQKPAQIDRGQFTLSQLKPDLPLKFFVRKGNAVNIPKVIPLDKLDMPLELTISEKNQVTCSGRVVNEEGKPIPGAVVTLVWNTELQRDPVFAHGPRKSAVQDLEFLKTDELGRFKAQGLWPYERFFVRVEAKGYHLGGPQDEGRVVGHSTRAGGNIDFGDTILTKRQAEK